MPEERVANDQSGPAIRKYLMENNGVKKGAFIAGNGSDPLRQRESGLAAAKARGRLRQRDRPDGHGPRTIRARGRPAPPQARWSRNAAMTAP